jgi:hypothetical protein
VNVVNSRKGPKPVYVGPSAVAAHLGVTRAAVSNWLHGRRGKIEPPPPEPDATVDGNPVWLKSRLPDWATWAAKRERKAMEPKMARLAHYESRAATLRKQLGLDEEKA